MQSKHRTQLACPLLEVAKSPHDLQQRLNPVHVSFAYKECQLYQLPIIAHAVRFV